MPPGGAECEAALLLDMMRSASPSFALMCVTDYKDVAELMPTGCSLFPLPAPCFLLTSFRLRLATLL